MLIGLAVAARIFAISARVCSWLSRADGSAPSPPALATAIAMSDRTGPAIGASRIGCSMPKRSGMRRSGHMMVPSRLRGVDPVGAERTGPAQGERASSGATPEETMKPGSLATLLHPFESGAVAVPEAGRFLFLGAEPGFRLQAGFGAGLSLVQGFRPYFRKLAAAGHKVRP